MSQEHVEMFREGLAGWNREGVTGVLPLISADIRAYPFPEWPGPPIYRGHQGFTQLTKEWTENFDEYFWEEEDVIDVGDRVVGLVHHRGRIKGTAVPIRQAMGTIWGAVQDRKFSEVRFFLTFEEARAAAGLSE